VKPNFSNPLIATNTKMALQNGGIYGIVFEIEAFTKRIQREIGKINVILTGGDAIKFGELLECKKFVLPNLVLTGLNAILKHNED
jgi:type III pantothenate kinase